MSVISSQPATSALEAWLRRLPPSQPSHPELSTADASAAPGAPPARLPAGNGDLQQSLNQGWQDYMSKLRVNLNQPVKQQSKEADAMQKQLLKRRVDSLRQMMLMTHDKASLRALAGELACLARELKELVTSMSRNAADDPQAVGLAAGGGASAADGAASTQAGDEGEAASTPSADDAGSAASAADAPSGSGVAAQDGSVGAEQGADGGQRQTEAAAAAAANPQAALSSMLAKGNPVAGDPDIQEMQQTLKMVQAFIKQMAQQLRAQEKDKERQLQDDMRSADKALQDVDKILKGGPEALAAMGESPVSVSVQGGGEAAASAGPQAAE
ncbi:hypothetical protein [Chromobacterium alticapitis]|uniref:Uncharacterized protein n=1 Tax=Chromobacterium alticapitis TaxID=2073169 RepID=A0A2S5DL05_9NEIS|nr:hypothetical protein [Chromobacterium alticapitis]POZ63691.1 hypothetical protein C2I19_01960 [Chromobacterium alticapitis]